MRTSQSLNAISLKADRAKIGDAILYSAFLLVICWAVFVMDEYLGYPLKEFGMKPRTFDGLRGIVTIHFLHGDLEHIVQNSLALFVLNSFVFYFYRAIALPSLPANQSSIGERKNNAAKTGNAIAR